MKKYIAVLLAFVMCLSLCACGSDGEPSPNDQNETTNIWSVVQSVDDFGDVVDSNVKCIGAVFHGDFSNTATNSSDLTVKVYARGNDLSTFVLELLEYDDMKALFYGSDEITVKIKVGDTITEYSASGAGGYIFVRDSRWSENYRDYYPEGTGLYEALMMGNDVRFVIEVGSSKYNFTVEAGNFNELATQLMQE